MDFVVDLDNYELSGREGVVAGPIRAHHACAGDRDLEVVRPGAERGLGRGGDIPVLLAQTAGRAALGRADFPGGPGASRRRERVAGQRVGPRRGSEGWLSAKESESSLTPRLRTGRESFPSSSSSME